MNIELNRILHQPIRTKIMAYLVTCNSADYNTIKNKFNLSDGHMTTHMKELIENQYISVEKKFIDNKPKTTYFLTAVGKTCFLDYVNALKNIILIE